MKIYVISRNKIYICSVILFIILVVSSIYVQGYSLVKPNGVVEEEFDNKIKELCNRKRKGSIFNF